MQTWASHNTTLNTVALWAAVAVHTDNIAFAVAGGHSFNPGTEDVTVHTIVIFRAVQLEAQIKSGYAIVAIVGAALCKGEETSSSKFIGKRSITDPKMQSVRHT